MEKLYWYTEIVVCGVILWTLYIDVLIVLSIPVADIMNVGIIMIHVQRVKSWLV